MKAIMYHYVRPHSSELDYFRHLDVSDFRRQLDYFEKEFGFVSKADFKNSLISGEPSSGIVLTFDDGFKDHYRYVLPELVKRKLWGVFYIPTSPYLKKELIDVHRIHMLLGKYGGKVIADALQKIISDDLLSKKHISEFKKFAYKVQGNDSYTKYVKQILNYFIHYKYRKRVIDELMSIFYPDESDLIANFYMTEDELREMRDNGMILGSHTINHVVMSKLSVEEQSTEIISSFNHLNSIVGKTELKTFCYPYGGHHSFTRETEHLLADAGCHFSFNVEARDISQEDIKNRRQALPRYDCNQFLYGTCR